MRHGDKQTGLPRSEAGDARDGRPTTEQLAGVRENEQRPGRGDADARPAFPGEATAEMHTNVASQNGTSKAAERDRSGMPSTDRHDDTGPLLDAHETEEFRTAWRNIQSEFVDRPKDSVRSADALVAEVMRTLARTFASHKDGLESQWARGSDVATEDLRVALQHY
ncbi:MAG TPA: hypothetical protein VLH10_00240, partial [Yinghuangia sp.]|nr:hypothetical protein [Yinghuangia sp.]